MVWHALTIAGGRGLRVGRELPKQLLPIRGKPVLVRIIKAFYAYNVEIRIIPVLPYSQQSYQNELCRKYHFSIPHHIANDGETCFHPVRNGLTFVIAPRLVGVCDGVRPFVAREVTAHCYSLAAEKQTVVPVTGVVEMVRHLVGEGSEAVSRNEYKLVQTPRVLDADLLKQAYEQPYTSHFTDDALAVEALGKSVYLTESNQENIRITTPFDLKMATALLESRSI